MSLPGSYHHYRHYQQCFPPLHIHGFFEPKESRTYLVYRKMARFARNKRAKKAGHEST